MILVLQYSSYFAIKFTQRNTNTSNTMLSIPTAEKRPSLPQDARLELHPLAPVFRCFCHLQGSHIMNIKATYALDNCTLRMEVRVSCCGRTSWSCDTITLNLVCLIRHHQGTLARRHPWTHPKGYFLEISHTCAASALLYGVQAS